MANDKTRKARPLGNAARQMIGRIDMEAASGFRKLESSAEGTPMLRAEWQLVASRVQVQLLEIRRICKEVETLGLGTGQLTNGDEQ